jgi:predicted transcriptional regulator
VFVSLQTAKGTSEGPGALPSEVRSLFRREQQIAAIVYRSGAASAKEVECQIPDAIANASVRSMLNRLVGKGILLRSRSGYGKSFLYTPGLTESFARQRAIRQFADDFHEGFLSQLIDDIRDFLARPLSLDELLDDYDRTAPLEVRQLADRMREIATVVYRSGASSGQDILTALCGRGGGGIRTLMNRLEDRQIVRKRRSGRHRGIVYLPAVVTRQVRRLALKRLIDERFEASAEAALQSALQAMSG